MSTAERRGTTEGESRVHELGEVARDGCNNLLEVSGQDLSNAGRRILLATGICWGCSVRYSRSSIFSEEIDGEGSAKPRRRWSGWAKRWSRAASLRSIGSTRDGGWWRSRHQSWAGASCSCERPNAFSYSRPRKWSIPSFFKDIIIESPLLKKYGYTPHSHLPQQRILSTYAVSARQTSNSENSARTRCLSVEWGVLRRRHKVFTI